MTKIITLILPYFFKYFPENTVKQDAASTPSIIKKSPFNVSLRLSSTLSDIQKVTPEIAIKTAKDLLKVIFSILKKKAITIVQSGIVA